MRAPLMAAAVPALLFGALLFGALPAHARQVTVLVPGSTASTPFFLMEAVPELCGLAEDGEAGEGLDIAVEVFVNHPQALGRLYRGEVQLLFTGTSAGWESRLEGGPIRMIDTGVWGVSYLIGKNPDLDRFSLLAGKSIALPFPGAPLDFQTRYILAHEGIAPGEVRIRYSPFTQTIALLVRGQVDAAPLPEPLATSAVREQGLFRLVSYAAVWERITGSPYSPQVSLFSTVQYAERQAGTLENFLQAWRLATSFTAEHPGRTAGLTADRLPFSRDILTEAIENTLYDLPSPEENRRRVTEYFNRVRSYLPGGPEESARERLDRGFFFLPEN